MHFIFKNISIDKTSARGKSAATYYAGAMETEINNGAVTVKTYWPMGLGVGIDKPDGSLELNWTHLDRLGSVVAISDAAGNLKERLAYDSWGKRRTINGEATPDSLDGATDNRGFTGHEMLDKLDLVHMNGRFYDPLVARFISADPIIQDPEHSQSYNRYSYVRNNPTNLTDPTGFISEGYASESYSGDWDGNERAMPTESYERSSASYTSTDRTGVSFAMTTVPVSGSLGESRFLQWKFEQQIKEIFGAGEKLAT